MLWPGLSSTYYDQIALWFYEENVTHLAMPGIAKAHLTWNSVKARIRQISQDWLFPMMQARSHAPFVARKN